MFRVIVIGLALIASLPAMADTDYTGNEMLQPCATFDEARTHNVPKPPAGDAFLVGTCMGMVSGIRFLVGAATYSNQYAVCVPPGVNNGQSVSVVVRYMRNHPELLHKPFKHIVLAAFFEAWPCKR